MLISFFSPLTSLQFTKNDQDSSTLKQSFSNYCQSLFSTSSPTNWKNTDVMVLLLCSLQAFLLCYCICPCKSLVTVPVLNALITVAETSPYLSRKHWTQLLIILKFFLSLYSRTAYFADSPPNWSFLLCLDHRFLLL